MSDDDPILERLGARVREDRGDDALPEGVRPFDAAAQERIAARLLGDAKAAPAAKVVALRGRWAYAALPLAAAAALLVYVGTRGRGDLPPEYEMGLVSANAHRSPGDSPKTDVTLDPDGDVELVARPAAPARGIGARTVIIREGAAKPWHPPIEVSDEGAGRITGRTKALFPATDGLYDLVVVVAKESALPNEDEAVRIATGTLTEGSRYRVLRARVRFVEKK